METIKGDSRLSTAERTVDYYRKSLSYLIGPFRGTCHFGYTPQGQRFKLESDLHSMETLLGQKLAVPSGSVVLDAGCGYGRVATTLASEHGFNVIGIDLIPERLKEASRYANTQGVSTRVKLLNGNYCTLPFKDSTFSAVFTMETLVHADPLEAALGEFWRVLKPGGRLVLFEYSVPDRASVDPLRQRLAENIARRTGMASIERFTHGGFPAILHGVHFEDVTVEDISRNVWPTWHWLFWRAIRDNWVTILRGRVMQHPNLAGSLLIWPHRHHLGYKIVTAIKPAG